MEAWRIFMTIMLPDIIFRAVRRRERIARNGSLYHGIIVEIKEYETPLWEFMGYKSRNTADPET